MTPEEIAKKLYRGLFIAYEADDSDEKHDMSLIVEALQSFGDAEYNRGVDTMARAAAEFCWDPENRDKCMALAKNLRRGSPHEE